MDIAESQTLLNLQISKVPFKMDSQNGKWRVAGNRQPLGNPPKFRATGFNNHSHIQQIRHRGARKSSSNYVTHKELTGGKMNVPSNPPSVSYQPWMPIIVVHTGKSGEIVIKMSDLVNQLIQQIDPTNHAISQNPVINIKIRSVRAWNVSGTIIALSVDDFSDADKAIKDVDMLCGIVDTGSASHVPAVGYDLPVSLKNVVLRNGSDPSTDKDVILYHIVSGQNDSVIIYTSIFWKFDGPSKFTGFQSTMMQAICDIRDNTDKTKKNTKALTKVTKDILDAMPNESDRFSFLASAMSDCQADSGEEVVECSYPPIV